MFYQATNTIFLVSSLEIPYNNDQKIMTFHRHSSYQGFEGINFKAIYLEFRSSVHKQTPFSNQQLQMEVFKVYVYALKHVPKRAP